jgi:hypothetical protein
MNRDFSPVPSAVDSLFSITGTARLVFASRGLDFPELDLRAFLPFANLPTLFGSLLIGHPAGIVIPAA